MNLSDLNALFDRALAVLPSVKAAPATGAKPSRGFAPGKGSGGGGHFGSMGSLLVQALAFSMLDRLQYLQSAFSPPPSLGSITPLERQFMDSIPRENRGLLETPATIYRYARESLPFGSKAYENPVLRGKLQTEALENQNLLHGFDTLFE